MKKSVLFLLTIPMIFLSGCKKEEKEESPKPMVYAEYEVCLFDEKGNPVTSFDYHEDFLESIFPFSWGGNINIKVNVP